MVTAAELAAISAADYSQPADIAIDGLHLRFTRVADELVVSLRGSDDLADWWQNFKPGDIRSVTHPKVGKLAAAFAVPLLAKYDEIKAAIAAHPYGPSPTVIGHSRGGAQAQVLAGLLLADGIQPRQLVTFGAPRCGSVELSLLLQNVAGADYQNGSDPVVYVPFVFRRPRILTPIGKRGIMLDINDHFIAAYQASLNAA